MRKVGAFNTPRKMEGNLREKTIYALFWSLLESVGLQGVRFIVGIVLARLLFPEQFGLMGMLVIFMAVAQSFLDSGFGAALIQKQDATQVDICSIFYFNIAVGLMAAGLLCMIAPWIAAFYNQPILTPMTRVLSLTIVINSFGLIQNTLLRKQIDFKTQTKVSLVASGLSGMIGVFLAVRGFGVWSLVVQQITNAMLWTTLLWYLNSWRPQLIFSISALKKMFCFGSRMLASGLLNQIFDNIYLIVIGRLFMATELGLFTRAKQFEMAPSQTLSGMVARVTFPVFSIIQNEPQRIKKALKKALTTLALLNFPMMIGLVVTAKPLVLVLLTEKWAQCVPYLQLLCFVGLSYPLQAMNLNVLQALGRSDLFFRLEVMKKVLIVINIVITWRWGIEAMIVGQIIVTLISYYLNSYYNGIFIAYSISEQLRDILPSLVVAVLMGGAVYMVGRFPIGGNMALLIIQIIAGIALYVGMCRLLRVAAFMGIWQEGWRKIAISRTLSI